jgi:DNA-binding response OmpR family regulator
MDFFMHILIAEDDAEIAVAPAGALRCSGHAVQLVDNGVGCSVIDGLRISVGYPWQLTRA